MADIAASVLARLKNEADKQQIPSSRY